VIVQEQVKVIPTFDLKKHPCVHFDEKQEPLLLCVAQTEVTELWKSLMRSPKYHCRGRFESVECVSAVASLSIRL
jgi:hypothetical protein